MSKNFWEKLPKLFYCLAPMMDITDSPFRQIVSECGKPDVFYAWFASVDGLCSIGKKNILSSSNLKITAKEYPLVVQLFGRDPEKFFKSAKILSKLGFDGIDINMGCPDKDILRQGAGAELIKNPNLAREIIRATKKGSGSLPVSVKTRIGFYGEKELENWISELARENPAAVCVHGRTAKQKYGGSANWKAIKRSVEILKKNKIVVIGNGDVQSREDGLQRAGESGVDGIMIGRAILGNPWIFNKNKKDISKEEKIKMLVKHAKLFEKYHQDKKSFGNFRKYLRCYISRFGGSKKLRMKIMEADSAEDMKNIFSSSA